ncbi:MAG: integron integrase, partial [bacterium]|nr:integron integrase [bacterium]
MKLIDDVCTVIRKKHYSIRTEQAYVDWIKRFIFFHGGRHPSELGEKEISKFISHLAVKQNVAASTQNQALNAIVFLYKQVLKIPLGDFLPMERAKRPARLPVVFTKEEARNILGNISGVKGLMAGLLYGSGLRLMECVRLRIQDIDFHYAQLTIRDGKGHKDRVTMLPEPIKAPLQTHLAAVHRLHDKDLQEGCGRVYLPYALERKYKNA